MIQSYRVHGIAGWAKVVVELSKIRISQLVAFSTLAGYILATGELSLYMIVPTLGTFLLSCGSAALNQYQEWEFDRRMNRTRGRPVPSGRATPLDALTVAAALLLSGVMILYWGTNSVALILGLFNVLWYNGVYTPLKRLTPFAVFPGSLIGAIPPAIGWTAAGLPLDDMRIVALGFFFFMWQVPHFWLLLFNFGKDYEDAGFPSLTAIFGVRQLGRLTFMWLLATILACLMLPVFGVGSSPLLFVVLVLAGIWLLWSGRRLPGPQVERIYFRHAFMRINIYILVVMLSLTLDRLLV